MRSMRRALPKTNRIGRWLALAACSLTITISFFSCTISADAGHPEPPTVRCKQPYVASW